MERGVGDNLVRPRVLDVSVSCDSSHDRSIASTG